MRKPKNCYSDPHYSWLRVAIWQAYNCKDYYNGEAISFREMEIDHIVSQDIYRTPNKLKDRLKELGLPTDFQKDDLLNFVPTRGGANVEKYKLEGDQVLLKALSIAKQKKESIKQKIDDFFSHADAIEAAAKIAANITNEEQRKDVIDIVLHDMEDFREETCINQNSRFYGLPNQFVKSTKNIRLIGCLPEFKNPTPSCVIEFRTLFLRGITLCVPGTEVLSSLCRCNQTPIDESLRSYLQKDYHNDYFYWTLGNCSFELERYETEELCNIIDEYADAYINALRGCEKAYDFEDCCLVNGSIRLLRIRQSIYNYIYQYIIENPTYYHGLRLECNLDMLRLDSSGGRLHFMIMLENAKTSVWHSEPEFWMNLSTFYGEHDGIMEREELWAPSQVRQWLLHNLIPDAIRWSIKKSMPRLRLWNKGMVVSTEERVKDCMSEIVYSIKMLDKRIPDKICCEKDLLDAVCIMQSYFSLNSTPGYYGEDGARLYDALLILLERAKLKRYSYEYIAGNLGCFGLGTKEEVIAVVKNRIKEQRNKRFYSSREIELVLRCLKECMDRNAEGVGFQTTNDVTGLLSDFISIYNRNILIKKYL